MHVRTVQFGVNLRQRLACQLYVQQVVVTQAHESREGITLADR